MGDREVSYFCAMEQLRTVNVTRYVTPLREGGSLPAIAEADDGFMYVLKFRGAGQGKKALIAELIGGKSPGPWGCGYRSSSLPGLTKPLGVPKATRKSRTCSRPV